MLEVRNVTKRFGSLVAVQRRIDVGKAGELRAIIGPNGAGKTTFFNMISGYFAPTEGTIMFDGQDVTQVPAHTRVALGMGRTFQITEIFPELTVHENVLTAAEVAAGNRCTCCQRAPMQNAPMTSPPKCWRWWGFTGKADRLVGELAHGDQRATEIAMSLAQRPRLLLLDEPTAGMGDQETYRHHRVDSPAAPRQQIHHRADRARHARGLSPRRLHHGARSGQFAGRRDAEGNRAPPKRCRRPISGTRSQNGPPRTVRAGPSARPARWWRRCNRPSPAAG